MIPPVASRPPVSPSRVANTRCPAPGSRASRTVHTSTTPGSPPSHASGTRRPRGSAPPATAAATEPHVSPDTVAAPALASFWDGLDRAGRNRDKARPTPRRTRRHASRRPSARRRRPQVHRGAAAPSAHSACAAFARSFAPPRREPSSISATGIPAFRLDGRALVWYAAFRRHIEPLPDHARPRARAPASTSPVTRRRRERSVCRWTSRCRSPLVKRIVKARVSEARERAAAARDR